MASQYTRTSQEGVWEKLEITMQAPPEAAWVSVILYRTSATGSTMWFDDVSLSVEG